MDDPATFAARLRRSCVQFGIGVSVATTVDIVRAVVALGEVGPRELYVASRALCVHRFEELEWFDRAFALACADADFEADREYVDGDALEQVVAPVRVDDDSVSKDNVAEAAGTTSYSPAERLWSRDIASCNDEEIEAIHRLLDASVHTGALRRRYRMSTSQRACDAIDLRRSLSRMHETHGEIVRPAYRRRRIEPRQVVILLDISGSMEAYVPTFMRLIHLLSQTSIPIEAFSLGTRLTRVTKALGVRDVDRSLSAIGALVGDWSGGTRLGATLTQFVSEFGARGVARAATVVVISDGLDRGDPKVLASAMARLSRIAHRVIWMNPLRGSEGYQPLARGMATALPFVDEFVSGHSLQALADLLVLLDGNDIDRGDHRAS